MQGHRSAIGSLPESLDFDEGSSSTNAAIDQHSFWGNMRSPGDQGIPEFVLPTGDSSLTCLSSVGHEGHNLSRWDFGESSSSSRRNEANHERRKACHGWVSSSSVGAGLGLRLEEPQHEPNSIFSQNNANLNADINQNLNVPLFMQSSASAVNHQNLNLNAQFVGHVDDDCQIMENPNHYKSSVSANGWITSSSSSEPVRATSDYSVVRPGSLLEARRLSRRRKASERSVGQSSGSSSSRSLQRTESIGWQAAPPRSIPGRPLSISRPSENISGPNSLEHLNPRLGLGLSAGVSGSHPAPNMAENSERNIRMRFTPPSSQNHLPPLNLAPTMSQCLNLNASSTQQPSRILPVNHSLNLSPAPPADNTHPQNQHPIINPIVPQGVQSESLNVGNVRNMSRSTLEIPPFIPVNRLRRQISSRTLAGGSRSIPGNSVSRTGSSSSVHSSSTPPWVPHLIPNYTYPRRVTEYVQQAFMSPIGSDSGASFLQEDAPSSGINNELGNHHTHPRSALWMERQADGAFGLRTLAAAGEGRSRLVSELRSVLNSMRRGEGLRFEDMLMLDQQMQFGVTDAHDRHRDMRLDVDNMTYEELLALEDRIGNVNTGLTEEVISSRLKQRKHVPVTIEDQSEAEPCSICREDYTDGEELGILDCGHNFHTECIKQWLTLKNLCPICKTAGLVT